MQNSWNESIRMLPMRRQLHTPEKFQKVTMVYHRYFENEKLDPEYSDLYQHDENLLEKLRPAGW